MCICLQRRDDARHFVSAAWVLVIILITLFIWSLIGGVAWNCLSDLENEECLSGTAETTEGESLAHSVGHLGGLQPSVFWPWSSYYTGADLELLYPL